MYVCMYVLLFIHSGAQQNVYFLFSSYLYIYFESFFVGEDMRENSYSILFFTLHRTLNCMCPAIDRKTTYAHVRTWWPPRAPCDRATRITHESPGQSNIGLQVTFRLVFIWEMNYCSNYRSIFQPSITLLMYENVFMEFPY